MYEVRCRDGFKRYFAYARDLHDCSLIIVKLSREEAEKLGVDEVIDEEELEEHEREIFSTIKISYDK